MRALDLVNAPAQVFHQALVREMLDGSHRRLGDAVLAAQEDYAATGLFPELLRIYTPFGDPALRRAEIVRDYLSDATR